MRRLAVFAVVVCLCASGVVNAADQAEIELAALVEKAERARAAGRWVEAAEAYDAALTRRRDPVIAGRYGLVLMKLGHLASAAQELHAAFERGQGVSPQERREIVAAYDKAKAATTWVNVDISQMGATVLYDGNPLSRDGLASFYMFSMPGEHTLRAELDGYEAAEVTFTAKPGEEITVKLRLVLITTPEPFDQTRPLLERLHRKKPLFPPMLPTTNVADDPNYSAKEDPYYGEPKETKPAEKKSGPRFSVSGGIVTVFGVASWNPAIGGVLGVGLRPHDNFSIGLEGRAAWLTTGVGGGQISAMTAGGILSACGHLKWFFGCGLGYLGTLNVAFSEQSYTGKRASFVKPGVGVRVGGNIRLASSFVMRPSFDILGLASETKIVAGEQVVADQPAVQIGAQITGGWEF